MRTFSITIHNNLNLEVFVEKLKNGFEVWKVGAVKGRRVILDHYVTHDDLEAKLDYANCGDLVWTDASISELPSDKHLSAIQMEQTIKQGIFIDFEKGLKQPLIHHFGNIVNLFPVDRKVFNAAKKAILGRWVDSTASVDFKPDAKLNLVCPTDMPHPFNSGVRTHGFYPDWWNFAGWQLSLFNNEHKNGMRIGVIRVDDQELHVWNESHSHKLVHVFYRAKTTE